MNIKKMMMTFFVGLMATLTTMTASAVTLDTTKTLTSRVVQGLLNGDIGVTVAIGLVVAGAFMAFRSAMLGVLALVLAILFWNADTVLEDVLGLII